MRRFAFVQQLEKQNFNRLFRLIINLDINNPVVCTQEHFDQQRASCRH